MKDRVPQGGDIQELLEASFLTETRAFAFCEFRIDENELWADRLGGHEQTEGTSPKRHLL